MAFFEPRTTFQPCFIHFLVTARCIFERYTLGKQKQIEIFCENGVWVRNKPGKIAFFEPRAFFQPLSIHFLGTSRCIFGRYTLWKHKTFEIFCGNGVWVRKKPEKWLFSNPEPLFSRVS